jgi:hypothetical protein
MWSKDPFILLSLLKNTTIIEPRLLDNRDSYVRDIEAKEEDAVFE